MRKKLLTVLILLVWSVLPACNQNGLSLKIRFARVEGLKPGNRVLFEQNPIGSVTEVIYSEEGIFLVSVHIEEHFTNTATEHARFFIVSDPAEQNRKAVRLVHLREGGSLLPDNTTVKGSTETSVLFQQITDGIKDGLERFENQVEQFANEIKKIPESEEFTKLENELRRLTKEMKRSGQQTRKTIKEEVLPQLREKMEELRKRLQELGREKEMKPLEEEMKKMQKI